MIGQIFDSSLGLLAAIAATEENGHLIWKIIESIAWGSIVGTLIAAYLQRRHAWHLSRAKMTSDLISEWDSKSSEQRLVLEDKFGSYWKDPVTFATEDERQQFAKSEEEATKKERLAIIFLFNRLEDFAALYREEHYDWKIIDNLMKEPVRAIYRKFEEPKRALEEIVVPPPHRPRRRILDELIDDWNVGRKPRRLSSARSNSLCQQCPLREQ
jgi:hypothetical protein